MLFLLSQDMQHGWQDGAKKPEVSLLFQLLQMDCDQN